ncbi:hypothetical protein BDV10DRAFT_193180 [Aspergillus recurvatus]
MCRLKFNPDKDIPDLTGKAISIIVGSARISALTAIQLAMYHAARIYLNHPAISFKDKRLFKCNVTSLAGGRGQCSAAEARLDVFICSVGIMATPPGLTGDEYEAQSGTNHLGPAVPVRESLPLLQETANSHGASSATSLRSSRADGFSSTRSEESERARPKASFGPRFGMGRARSSSRTFCMQRSLRGLPSVTSMSIHPGVVSTNLVDGLTFGKRLFVSITTLGQNVSPEEGSYTALWAASTTTKDQLVNGAFYEPDGKGGGLIVRAAMRGQTGSCGEWPQRTLDGY